ncbi:MAG: tetratricopeptide repeat protein [Deltaproteobacteria bacterium]|nr:tetratricopeptide repeat protein [Deltaproteobacteria bacterium]
MRFAIFRFPISNTPISNFCFPFFLLFLLFLSGCVAFQVGGEIQRGRIALLDGNPKVALAHFQSAAELNPGYLLNFSPLDQGVWTYVGRAYYAMGKLPEAKKALERARSKYEQDHLAKLYLGLVLVRDGDRPGGLREIHLGLRRLLNWLDHMERYDLDGPYWDPNRRLRSEIEKDLAMIEGRDIIWSELISSGEWLGVEFEEEIDLASEDRIEELEADGDDSDGMN